MKMHGIDISSLDCNEIVIPLSEFVKRSAVLACIKKYWIEQGAIEMYKLMKISDYKAESGIIGEYVFTYLKAAFPRDLNDKEFDDIQFLTNYSSSCYLNIPKIDHVRPIDPYVYMDCPAERVREFLRRKTGVKVSYYDINVHTTDTIVNVSWKLPIILPKFQEKQFFKEWIDYNSMCKCHREKIVNTCGCRSKKSN
jgi:hypothetical protein